MTAGTNTLVRFDLAVAGRDMAIRSTNSVQFGAWDALFGQSTRDEASELTAVPVTISCCSPLSAPPPRGCSRYAFSASENPRATCLFVHHLIYILGSNHSSQPWTESHGSSLNIQQTIPLLSRTRPRIGALPLIYPERYPSWQDQTRVTSFCLPVYKTGIAMFICTCKAQRKSTSTSWHLRSKRDTSGRRLTGGAVKLGSFFAMSCYP